ncbi:MAG: hypothetical protein HYS12_29955 [Planctomycetes bacterium]|nr:hypothetical protein [Planctomycetota bacterium]
MLSRRFGLAVLLAGLLMQPLVGPASLRAEEKVAGRARLVQRSYLVADLLVPLKPVVVEKQGKRGPVSPDHGLVKLITHMIAVETWQVNGGCGTIDYFPLGMTLVVNQTLEVHRQIEALLKTLRAEQETNVSCEIRLISVDADFGQRVLSEFGIPTKSKTEVTFLSHEQLRKFCDAIQAHLGTSVLQTPKITMRNGQEATLRVCNMQFFVTRVDVSWDGEQVRGMPINTPIATGVVLSVQPLVAADRQSVRLHFQANLTSLESQKVGLSPVTTKLFPIHESGEKAEPVTFTQFIQTPKVITLSADKVLSIPEGRTAVLSGWKQKREVSKKWALPLLGELPYLGSLFRYEWQEPVCERILFMVTPRVVLPEKVETYERIHGGIE